MTVKKAKVGVYKVDSETGNYLAGAVFNLYATDDIYSVDGKTAVCSGRKIAYREKYQFWIWKIYYFVKPKVNGGYYG